jgi:mannitol 2-dehydrogenase
LQEIFGDLARDPTYVRAFAGALTSIWKVGTRQTLLRYLGDDLAPP